ncbi:MAG: hypothetical protein H6741_25715 [Alphaproteobacteria bacterium]|nr:hypothetical protein [Alphaproteobacteria bacterium]MCB9796109.1 hypothetical protein [Alphaproteobacteria bacterium]
MKASSSLWLPALLAALGALFIGEVLLQGTHGAWNLDEEGYRLAASQMARWRLCLPMPEGLEGAEALRSVHGFFARGALCAKYGPGAPALFAPGFALGLPRLGPALCTGLAVLGVGLLGRGLGAGTRAAWLAALCPLLLLNGSLFLSEAPALGVLALGLSVTSAGSPFLGGLLLGLVGLTKTPLAAAALPAFLWLAGPRGVWPLLLGGLPPLAALAAHAIALTGDPLTLPFSAYWPLDRPGFGPEVGGHPLEFPDGDGHAPAEGLRNLGVNLLLLALWAGGHGGVLLLAARQAWRRRGERLAQALVLLSLGVFGLYFAYWYPGELSAGPVYMIPLLAAALPLAATAEGRLERAVLLSGVLLSFGVASAQWQRALGPAVAGRAALQSLRGLVILEGEGLLPVANTGFDEGVVYSREDEAVRRWWEVVGSGPPTGSP